jgi:hypothetical protein
MRRMMKIGVVFILAVFCFASPGWAQHQHGSHPPPAPSTGGEKKAEPTTGNEASSSRTFLLDGTVKASFAILSMADHRKMLLEMKMKVEVDLQATHNIAVSLIDVRSNLPLNEAVVKMKVISPKGKEEGKILDHIPAMNQYSGDFALPEKGRYQILILFKSGGKKQAGGFYYRVK